MKLLCLKFWKKNHRKNPKSPNLEIYWNIPAGIRTPDIECGGSQTNQLSHLRWYFKINFLEKCFLSIILSSTPRFSISPKFPNFEFWKLKKMLALWSDLWELKSIFLKPWEEESPLGERIIRSRESFNEREAFILSTINPESSGADYFFLHFTQSRITGLNVSWEVPWSAKKLREDLQVGKGVFFGGERGWGDGWVPLSLFFREQENVNDAVFISSTTYCHGVVDIVILDKSRSYEIAMARCRLRLTKNTF